MNEKIYIGCTIRGLEKRFQAHKNAHETSGLALHTAMRKHGTENFTIELIEETETIEQMFQREIYWINKLNTFRGDGYNMTAGGEGAVGCKISEETKKKMSKAHLGKVLSEEHKKKISEASLGKVFSDETKQKLSEALLGKVFSEETRRKMSEAHLGRKISEETRRKMSKAQKTRQKVQKDGEIGE